MHHMLKATAALLAFVLALTGVADARNLKHGRKLVQTSLECIDTYGETPITFLFFADPGDYSGSSEAKHVMHNLKDLEVVHMFRAHCGSAWVGTLFGERTAIIMTGIGPMTAGMCTQAVLDKCGSHVEEAVYMGASAFPSVIGGVIQPQGEQGCVHVNLETGRDAVTRVGDVCITPYAINWDCKQADWGQQVFGAADFQQDVNNLCWYPEENWGPEASFLYGQCIFVDVPASSLDLVKELQAAGTSSEAKNATLQRSEAQLTYDEKYWTYMSNGTGQEYYQYPKDDPHFNVFTNCAEVDSQFFFSGPPYEAVNLNLSALALNLGTNTSDYNPSNVVFANAMEAIGFGKAMAAYNKYTTRPVPFVNMRGNSNYNSMPIAVHSNGTFVYESHELHADHPAGYSTAIDNFSVIILTMLKKRCMENTNGALCNFTMDR